MKTVIQLLLVFFACETSGFLIKVPKPSNVFTPTKTGSDGWTDLQRVILQLLDNICEDSTDPMIIRNAGEFTLDSSSGDYWKPEVVNNMQILQTVKGLLPKGEIFTEYNNDHLNELKVLYEVLYYAKDFSTFFKAAAWARQNTNCGLFFDAVYLAILSRRDTEALSVPAPWEILPNYFVTKDIIFKASTILGGEQITPSDTVHVVGNSYVLDANYTADIYENNDESKLAYFHEDVGLNSYYFFQKIKGAPWFNDFPEKIDRYGENLYLMMKQLAIRYDLERYSSGLPEIEGIDWNSFIATPYDPMLVYSNGNEFGKRTTVVDSFEAASLEALQSAESNISITVKNMISSGYNKTQILNHVMELLVTGDKSYETIARKIIGKDSAWEASLLSVMDHYITSLRDPVFWKLNKQIVNIVDKALKNIPTYTKSELYFPGIELVNVTVKKMSTAFETYEIDVTDSLKAASIDTTFQVKIEQPRLSHKPFTIKLSVASLVTDKGLVKIYLGPKVAPGEFASKSNQFMLLDSFETNFKIGVNVISRSSEEMVGTSEDLPSFRALRKKVENAQFGIDTTSFLSRKSKTGFPSRLILPKGSPEGLPFQIFVFIAPFTKAGAEGLNLLTNLEFNSAVLSPGFPLDLNIDDALLFNLPNAMLTDVVITHKGSKQSSYDATASSNKWQGGSGDGGRPEFTKKNFDYTLKKEQYAKKNNYEPETNDNIKDVEDKVENTNNVVALNNENLSAGKNNFYQDTFKNRIQRDSNTWLRSSGWPYFTNKDLDHTSKKGQYITKKRNPKSKKTDYIKVEDVEESEENKNTDLISNADTENTLLKIDLDDHKDQYNYYVSDKHPRVQDVDNVKPKTAKLTHPYFDVPSTNRTPTVYDYLFNGHNDIYYTEIKVYE